MNNNSFYNIQSAVTGLIGDLKPAPAEPAESKLTEAVCFDYTEGESK